MRFRTLRHSFEVNVSPLLSLSYASTPSLLDLRLTDLKLELTASRVREGFLGSATWVLPIHASRVTSSPYPMTSQELQE